ncbi:MAG: polyprenol monophosphomannose synthase [Candidatus Omnitrophota bacterium]|nr:polyprenol monophosphomannose synthase [Candidatus Omnitrophota bacterium]MBU1928577.1 polyprenol monophosphomannose synthase [Candidatus Omnitrophota bacterium]
MIPGKTIVVIPTYNERENISDLINRIFEVDNDLIVLFVDDNSPDGTSGLIENIAKYDKRIYLIKKEKEGIALAYVRGFEKALEMDPEHIIQMDADLSHNPAHIPEMLKQAESFDVVIGSRYISGGSSCLRGLFRPCISIIGAGLTRFMLGVKIRDVLGGYKCFKTVVLKNINFNKIRSRGFFFQAEMNYLLGRRGCRFKEIPIVFLKRNKGKSKFSLGMIWEAMALILFLRVN